MIFIVNFTDRDSGKLISQEIYSTRRAAAEAMKRRKEDFIKAFTEVYYKEEDEEQFECIGCLITPGDN
ncbi:MAG: hypothetical protein ACI3ZZ_06025 [Candidatus Aphodosoma sp.]